MSSTHRIRPLLLVALLAATAPAQVERRLSSGLRVVEVGKPGLPIVFAGVFLDRGAEADPAGKGGLVRLTCSMLWSGFPGKDEEQILRELEACGARSGGGADVDTSSVSVESLRSQFPRALQLLRSAVVEPTFPEDVLARRREETVALLAKREEDPGWLARRKFYAEAMPDHPYGRPVEGTPDSLPTITRADVAGMHRSLVHPARATLYLVGAFGDPERKLVDEAFGEWRPDAGAALAPPAIPEVPPLRGRRVVFVPRPGTTQAYIRIGNIAVPRSDPRRYALEVIDSALGGGFTSLLVDDLRVNQGLVYSVGCTRALLARPAPWSIVTSTKVETTLATIDGILGWIGKVNGGEIPPARIQTAKNMIVGLFPAALEDHGGLAAYLFAAQRHGEGLDAARTYPAKILAVTAEDVARAAATFDPENVLIVVVADPKAIAGIDLQRLAKPSEKR